MANKTNIPTGLNITSQIPLNYKEWVKDEATLAYLGIDDNLAFTYHDNIRIFCKNEKTLYEWREVKAGEENTGLVPLDFTYPNGLIVDGVDYSNRVFNFFKIEYQNLSDVINYESTQLGDGVHVYKDTTGTSNKSFNFKGLKTGSLIITEDANSVYIDAPSDSDTPEFIVNSAYTGDVETGSLAQPFKDIPQALAAYVGGVGFTNKNPENIGAIIRVKKGIGYTFTGVFAHRELNIIFEEGTNVVSDPATGNHLSDLDSDASLPVGMVAFSNNEPVTMYFTVEEGATVVLAKSGFKNRGTNTNTNSSLGKSIFLNGGGTIFTANDVSVVSPSTRNIIETNKENTAGFFNDGNVGNFYIDNRLVSYTTKIIEAGLNSKIIVTDNATLSFGVTNIQHNVDTVPFIFNGSTLDIKSCIVQNLKRSIDADTNNIFTFENGCVVTITNCDIVGTDVVNYFNCLTTDNNINLTTNIIQLAAAYLFRSASGISTIRLYSNFCINNIDYTQISIFAPAQNTINYQLVESLNTYTNKEAAITAGLFKGCKYIKRTLVTTGNFVEGEDYEIVNVGDTYFTLIGASANTVGIIFTATGVGTGTTGTANFDKLDIV